MKKTHRFFTTSYGFENSHVASGRLLAHPLVCSVPSCTLLHGLVDNPYTNLPPLFTIVPIFAMTLTTSGSALSHVPQHNV
jgi:hypothetical protein